MEIIGRDQSTRDARRSRGCWARFLSKGARPHDHVFADVPFGNDIALMELRSTE